MSMSPTPSTGADDVDNCSTFDDFDARISDCRCPPPVPIYLIIGQPDSGRNTVATKLSVLYNCPLVEAEVLRPLDTLDKISKGIPFTDEDTLMWLSAVRESCVSEAMTVMESEAPESSGYKVIATCLALKKMLRGFIQDVPKHLCRVVFVFLKASPETLRQRAAFRQTHLLPIQTHRSQSEELALAHAAPNEELAEGFESHDNMIVQIVDGLGVDQVVERVVRAVDANMLRVV